jgi:hypothetical protein
MLLTDHGEDVCLNRHATAWRFRVATTVADIWSTAVDRHGLR